MIFFIWGFLSYFRAPCNSQRLDAA